jgi:hypothetical protein
MTATEHHTTPPPSPAPLLMRGGEISLPFLTEEGLDATMSRTGWFPLLPKEGLDVTMSRTGWFPLVTEEGLDANVADRMVSRTPPATTTV